MSELCTHGLKECGVCNHTCDTGKEYCIYGMEFRYATWQGIFLGNIGGRISESIITDAILKMVNNGKR